MTGNPQALLRRKVQLARVAILWEALWRAAYPAVMVVGLTALAVLTGVLALLPAIVKLGALGLAGIAFLWSLRPILAVRMPDSAAGVRRGQLVSHLPHPPPPPP